MPPRALTRDAVCRPSLPKGAKLLYLVTEDWYFCSHRLELARAARREGGEIIVATRVQRDGETILRQGFTLKPVKLRRRYAGLWRELSALHELVELYRTERPALVHHVGMKPIVYGSLAALAVGVPAVVNTLAGMGHVFSSPGWQARLLRPLLRTAFRVLFRHENTRVILQNPEDRDTLISQGVVDPASAVLIRSSGVDIGRFVPSMEQEGIPVVVLAARMLWSKGVGEFVAAAEKLLARGIRARFVLVGGPDAENPMSIPPARIEDWQRNGVVEYWGRRDDMERVMALAHVVCLPTTYGEGVPKVLLEAAAAGRPVVATDVPGCREIVRHGENGLLVPARDPHALAEALQQLIIDAALRRRMGQRGREIVEAEFSVEKVVHETLALYRMMLA